MSDHYIKTDADINYLLKKIISIDQNLQHPHNTLSQEDVRRKKIPLQGMIYYSKLHLNVFHLKRRLHAFTCNSQLVMIPAFH